MPRSTFARDRFDEVSDDRARVGAHRAENPHLRGWVVFLWAAAATVVLIVIGIFVTLLAAGKITLGAEPTPTPTTVVTASPILDTSYEVIVLNATPVEGLATTVKDQVVAAGWSPDTVLASQAGSQDFATTTVYYALADDEGAARGLADAIGGADVVESDVYQPADDPETAEDESLSAQLVVVIGLDRVPTPSAVPTG